VGSTAFVLSNPLAPIGGCEDLIRSSVSERSDVCFWQASRPVARILEKIGFCVNEMGAETRIELGGYDFDGPRKRNFRRRSIAESEVVSVFKTQPGLMPKISEALLGPNAHVVAVDPATHRSYFPLKNSGGRTILRIMRPNS